MSKQKNQNIKLPPCPHFLIILMGSLGDVTRGLCLVSRIKKCLPKSYITWLIEPKWADLVSYHPQIDKILVFDRPNWKKGFKELFNKLRKNHFDCVLDLQRHFKSGLFSYLSGAKNRIGFHPKNAKEGNWLFNNHHVPYKGEGYPKINHYLTFLDYLECPKSKDLDFGFSGFQLRNLAPELAWLLKKPFLAMVLGSTWESKEWFFDGYVQLIRDIFETTSLDIVLVDSPAKYQMSCTLEKSINSSRLINLVGRTSVLELTGVLKEASLAVGPDCGSAHLASAVGTPYVSLFGPTSPERTAPYGSENLVVQEDLPCIPCYKRRCPRKDTLCMRLIQPKEVEKKILQALKIRDREADERAALQDCHRLP